MRVQLYFLLFFFICMIFVSCKRKGCTNAFCQNYDTEAKKDDGSCDCQEGAVSVYMKNDYGDVQVLINDDTLGVIGEYFPNEVPKCGQAGTLTLELSPGNYTLDAKGILGNTWQKQITIAEKNCELLLLE